ncbi:MAG TPA: type II secretion system F family protein [Firmicutes bacterium]|nr:type II secretion system F family protein [Bacillota bacterium]
MPSYHYTAKDWDGRTTEGVYSAGSVGEVLRHLSSRNLTVLNVREQTAVGAARQKMREPAAVKPRGELFQRKKKGRARDLMVFCRQFGTMLQAGMTALRGLQVLSQQMENPVFREVLTDVALSLEKGNTLAECFDHHSDFFPRILISMVEAGEAGGILDTVMSRLADHFERQHNLEEKIRSATVYPIVICVVAVAVMSVMVLFVLPKFAEIFVGLGIELPLLTRMLMGSGRFILSYWYFILALILALVLGARYYIQTPEGKESFDKFKLWIPLFGPIYQKMIIARFARTLSTLLASGVGILTSLELVDKVIDNELYSKSLERAREVIRQGQLMAFPLGASHLFPPMLVEMVHVGEETGALDEMLSRSADFYENEVTYVVERLSTVIEPVLLVVIGVFVGMLVVSIIKPMFQIYQTI